MSLPVSGDLLLFSCSITSDYFYRHWPAVNKKLLGMPEVRPKYQEIKRRKSTEIDPHTFYMLELSVTDFK